jgi:hypothetical protein
LGLGGNSSSVAALWGFVGGGGGGGKRRWMRDWGSEVDFRCFVFFCRGGIYWFDLGFRLDYDLLIDGYVVRWERSDTL